MWREKAKEEAKEIEERDLEVNPEQEKEKLKEKLKELEEVESKEKQAAQIKGLTYNELLDMIEGNSNRILQLVTILRRG